MELGKALRAVGQETRNESFALFSRTLGIDWVLRALIATGTASVRKRKLSFFLPPAALAACAGDCDSGGAVTVDELILAREHCPGQR
jgi:hypothetical protein